jgi:hypothetical protein
MPSGSTRSSTRILMRRKVLQSPGPLQAGLGVPFCLACLVFRGVCEGSSGQGLSLTEESMGRILGMVQAQAQDRPKPQWEAVRVARVHIQGVCACHRLALCRSTWSRVSAKWGFQPSSRPQCVLEFAGACVCCCCVPPASWQEWPSPNALRELATLIKREIKRSGIAEHVPFICAEIRK